MKTKYIISALALLFTFSTAEAQFFEKLGNKIKESATNTVINKSGNKTSEEVGQGFDSLFEGNGKKKSKKNRKKGKDIEAKNRYAFSYKYSLKLSTKKGEVFIDYYLEPNASYIGSKVKSMNQRGMDMFMIMDTDPAANYVFMNMGGGKMVRSSSLDPGLFKNENPKKALSEYKVTPLPNKEILGYDCKGMRLENNEWTITLYYTDELDVSFNNMFTTSKSSKNIPDELKEIFKAGGNSLMMSLEMTNKKSDRKSGKLTCVGLEEIDFVFKTNGYRSMGW